MSIHFSLDEVLSSTEDFPKVFPPAQGQSGRIRKKDDLAGI
jgi:hypothetical protein